MDGSSSSSRDVVSQSVENYQFQECHIEPIFPSFVCPLTKQVMLDPVTIENGNTFERDAIEKWFKECRDSGRKPFCPVTNVELKSTHMSPSITLRNIIEEWATRNEAKHCDMARRSLSGGTAEKEIIQALKFVQHISKESKSNKHAVHNAEFIHLIVEKLKDSSKEVRCQALETLRVIVEQDLHMKELMAEGDTVRLIVKLMYREQSTEREGAVCLLYELSKSVNLCDKIGSVNGAVLMLVGITSSKSEKAVTIEKADKTLLNLAQIENNVREMAGSGRLDPLLTLLLEGTPETKLSMASFLGDLALNNQVKVHVAETVGSSLVNLMRNGDIQSREASLKALNQISSYDASAKVLVEAGILPPLVRDLFRVGSKQLPVRLKEVSAVILSNVVNSGYNIGSVITGPGDQTLISEENIHNLLHLICNTDPSIECKLVQVLVGLTSYPTTVVDVVAAIQSSGATMSLVQFIEVPQPDLRLAAVKLLHNLSHHMSRDLAEVLCGSTGQLGSLLQIILDNIGTTTEEQASASGLLAQLPEDDRSVTQKIQYEDAFVHIISRVQSIRHGEIRGGRFMTPYLEGLVRSLVRVTYGLTEDPEMLRLVQEQNVASVFIELLQASGLDNVQIASAWALKNLSSETIKLTRRPNSPPRGLLTSLCVCFSKAGDVAGLCRVHGGLCSLKETCCLVEGQAVEKLVALLDHPNDKVVEASLAALSTLLEDGVNIEEGVLVLHKADGTKPILEVLVEKRSDNLRKRAVWVVERLLRNNIMAYQVADDQKVASALVDAFQHGDSRTHQIAERALKHVDRIPNFSGIFPNTA